ncbi:rod shape-determining protein [Ileibacterium valens]|uniref:rod shape-determining protein n=2 Tax=Ileibacterium valens TaxID=1862668 RepID=UPI00272BADDF|nr:rod shape-determining protein [Ileibacterium valens]
MGLIRKNYILDPGSYTFRLYNPDTGEITSIRTCQCQVNGNTLVGSQAIEASFTSEASMMRVPYSQGKAYMDISILFRELLKKARIDVQNTRANLLVILPLDCTEEDREVFSRQAAQSGFRKISFVKTMELMSKELSLNIHAGHSCTEIAVMHGRKPILYKKIIYGAAQMDEAIMDYIANKYRALLYAEDASALRLAASKAFSQGRNPGLSFTALDQSGQYVRISLDAYDLWPAMRSVIDQIILWIKTLIAQNGPDLMDRVLRHPVYLSGGLSECFGLSQMISEQLNVPVKIVSGNENALIEAVNKKRFL